MYLYIFSISSYCISQNIFFEFLKNIQKIEKNNRDLKIIISVQQKKKKFKHHV